MNKEDLKIGMKIRYKTSGQIDYEIKYIGHENVFLEYVHDGKKFDNTETIVVVCEYFEIVKEKITLYYFDAFSLTGEHRFTCTNHDKTKLLEIHQEEHENVIYGPIYERTVEIPE